MSNGPDVKVVLLGRHDAGKTCLCHRFVNNAPNVRPYQETIGAAFCAKRVDVDGKSIVIGLWDTAGSERYESLSRMFYRGAWAAIVCFDLTDSESFDRVKFWVDELKKNEEKCRIFLCGTKKDRIDADKTNRRVDFHTALDYAEENNAWYRETSSETGENIDEMFHMIADEFVSSPAFRSHPKFHVHLSAKSKQDHKCCSK